MWVDQLPQCVTDSDKLQDTSVVTRDIDYNFSQEVRHKDDAPPVEITCSEDTSFTKCLD